MSYCQISLAPKAHIFQMLDFKTANTAAATAASHLSAAYRAFPEHHTLAIASGLTRMFGASNPNTVPSRETSPSSTSEQRREREGGTAERRRKSRELDDIHRELDEYLEEPLGTFMVTERVDGNERTIFFDILKYWQVRKFLQCLLPATLTAL